MPLMMMSHDADPVEKILNKLPKDFDDFKLLSNYIMVAIYKRPDKTASGIYISDATKDEDKYQGKSALVIKKGPIAFVDDDRVSFHGQTVDVGQWVAFRLSDSWSLGIADYEGKEIDCRILPDTAVRLIIPRPDAIW